MSPVYTAKEGCSEAAGGSIKNHYWTNTTPAFKLPASPEERSLTAKSSWKSSL